MSSFDNSEELNSTNIKINKKNCTFSVPKTRVPSNFFLYHNSKLNSLDFKSHHDYSTEGTTSEPSSNKLLFSRRKLKPIIRKINDGIRRDFYGNRIVKGGNQKLTFVDKVSNDNLVEVILIDDNDCCFNHNNNGKDTALCSCNIF